VDTAESEVDSTAERGAESTRLVKVGSTLLLFVLAAINLALVETPVAVAERTSLTTLVSTGAVALLASSVVTRTSRRTVGLASGGVAAGVVVSVAETGDRALLALGVALVVVGTHQSWLLLTRRAET
jgi:hypothetical protein